MAPLASLIVGLTSAAGCADIIGADFGDYSVANGGPTDAGRSAEGGLAGMGGTRSGTGGAGGVVTAAGGGSFAGAGGNTGLGGTAGNGATAGATSAGGQTSDGGATASGGAFGAGGLTSSGGTIGSGGTLASGGATSSGGVTGSGGALGSGGQTTGCTPSSYFCVGNQLYGCSSSGVANLSQTCGSKGTYCDAQNHTCSPMVCVPNAPSCNGNMATTCNADGSGFLSGGSSCGVQYCDSGACTATLLQENFEDGDYAGWTVLSPGAYTLSVTTTTAANSTLQSLLMTKTGTTANFDGLSRVFSGGVTPSKVSWWIRIDASGSVAAAYFVLTWNAGLYNLPLVQCQFGSGGASCNSNGAFSYTTKQWHHMELRNIDWGGRTFDVYYDNTLVKAGNTMVGGGNSIGRIDLYSYSTSSTVYWDEISFQ